MPKIADKYIHDNNHYHVINALGTTAICLIVRYGAAAEFGINRTLRFSAAAYRSKLAVLNLPVLPPDVITSQIDVLPAQRRQILQQSIMDGFAGLA